MPVLRHGMTLDHGFELPGLHRGQRAALGKMADGIEGHGVFSSGQLPDLAGHGVLGLIESLFDIQDRELQLRAWIVRCQGEGPAQQGIRLRRFTRLSFDPGQQFQTLAPGLFRRGQGSVEAACLRRFTTGQQDLCKAEPVRRSSFGRTEHLAQEADRRGRIVVGTEEQLRNHTAEGHVVGG